MNEQETIAWRAKLAEATEVARTHLVAEGWNPRFPGEEGYQDPVHEGKACNEKTEANGEVLECTRAKDHEPPHASHVGPIGPQIMSWA